MERRVEKQTEEMIRAAGEITEAVKELRRSIDRLAESQRQGVSGGLSEEEAERLAAEAVREVRAEISRERKANGVDEKRLPPPTPEEIQEWERRREERRRREGYYRPR